ncbi:MAG: TraB/GumN family protein [Flavobacteriales bacterium]|nr:TraB/GumN family protein [Flavobacteriales bacterium]
MKKLLFALILLLSTSFLLNAQKEGGPKKYQGLLWEISGNGLSKPSYLYGTMHVSEKLAFHLSDTFFLALKKVDMVALELDPAQWMEETLELEKATNQREYLRDPGSSRGFYDYAFKIFFPEKNDYARIIRSKPRLMNAMLYRSSDYKNEYEEDTYLDLFIFQAGKKLNKKVVGLEDFMVSRKSVEKSYTGKEEMDPEKLKEEREMIRIRVRQMEKIKPLREYQEDAYRLGDLDMIDSLYRLMNPGTKFLKYMLWDRNIVMANGMDSLMKKNNSLFTGVGAAHLPGEKGVIELLRLKGYTVRPVVFTSRRDEEMKTEIENLKYPVKFEKQYPSDSLFSVDMPGKMYVTAERAGKTEYLFNDMSNGSYYFIQRYTHNGAYKGHQPDYILSRIDSLLYENVPGKIQSKKTIKSSNGFPGLDIVNKTRRGDLQRMQIYVTPLEIIVFRMSGRNDYISGPEGEIYFKSIQFLDRSNSSSTIVSSDHAFQFKIPGNWISGYNNSTYSGIQKRNYSSVDKDGNYYFMTQSQLIDFSYIEEDTFELNYLSERFAEDLNGKIVSRELKITDGRHDLYTTIEADGKNYQLRLYIAGDNYYMIGTNHPDKNTALNYVSSLKSLTYTYPQAFTHYTDTSLHFSVNTIVNPSPYSSMAYLGDDMGMNLFDMDEIKEEEAIYRPIRNSRFYQSYATGEKIFVEFRKFSMYYQMENPAEFWEKQEEDLNQDHRFILRKSKKGFVFNDSIRDYLVVDTNSTRGVLVRFIQKCGVLYTIAATVDTVAGASPFVSEFMRSFTPKDTCIGSSIYSEKINEFFFNKIYSADTLEKKRAYQGLNYVFSNLNEVHVEPLKKFISNPKFADFPLEDKREIISGLGRIKHKSILPYYDQLYQHYTDSSGIEFAILEGVANQRTQKSVELFLKLMELDLPVSANENDIHYILNPYRDSAQLAARLFPGILKFTKYPEYRNAIYSLMSELVKNGYLKKSEYSKFKKEILRDANYELKKYMASIEGNPEDFNFGFGGFYNDGFVNNEMINPVWDLTEEQQTLFHYVLLLGPFKGDAECEKFFHKLFTTPKEDLKILVHAYLQTQGYSSPDSLWNNYASDIKTRSICYRALAYYKQSDLFPSNYATQDLVGQSLLYGNSKDVDKDTIVLVKVSKISSPGASGNIYFYKARPKDKKVWKLGYVGTQPEDLKKINTYPELKRKGISFDGEEMMEKEISTILKKMRTKGRQRAEANDYGYGDYEDYEYGE